MGAGDALADRVDDLADLGWQRAPVGVAEHDPAGAALHGGIEASKRIVRVRLVAVEEMLGIEQSLAALGHQMGDRLADIGEVFVERDAERGLDMEVVRLADQADGGGARIDHLGQHLVIGGRAPRPLGHAEGGEGGGLQHRRRLEKIAVGGVGPGPAALDIVEAEIIQRPRDLDLIGGGEVDPLGLLAIAQRGVEEGEAFAGHIRRSDCHPRPPGAEPRAAPAPPPRAGASRPPSGRALPPVRQAVIEAQVITAPPAWPRRNRGKAPTLCLVACLLG